MASTNDILRDERLLLSYVQAIVMGLLANNDLLDVLHLDSLSVLEDPDVRTRIMAIAQAFVDLHITTLDSM